MECAERPAATQPRKTQRPAQTRGAVLAVRMRDIRSKTEETIARAALFLSRSAGIASSNETEDARYAAELFAENLKTNPTAKRHTNKQSADKVARLVDVLRGDETLGPVLSLLEAVVEGEGEVLTRLDGGGSQSVQSVEV